MDKINSQRLNRFPSRIAALAVLALGTSAANAFEILDCDTTIPPGSRTCSAGDLSNGWDGPGLGSYSLTYYLGNPGRADNGMPADLYDSAGNPLGLGPAGVLAAVDAAFAAATATWSSVVDVTFTKAGDYTDGGAAQFQSDQVDFYFHNGGIVSSIPFDGAWNPSAGTGSIFAHSWGPPDVTFDPTVFINGGNMHFDIAEQWTTDPGGSVIDLLASSAIIDLESIILHELGHVLGLGHEDDLGSGPGAPIMQSFHNVSGTWGRTLHPDDIAGMRSLYACVGTDCADAGAVPEPGTLMLMGMGVVSLVTLRRRRQL